MLIPKRQKHRKHFRGRMKGNAGRGNQLNQGEFGLQAMSCGWIDGRQIEAARVAMTRHARRGGKVWIRIFPDKPVTKRGQEMPMGKGKGTPEYFVAVVKPGRIMFEMAGVEPEVAREAMRLAAHKLPIKTQFVTREEQD